MTNSRSNYPNVTLTRKNPRGGRIQYSPSPFEKKNNYPAVCSIIG